MTRSPERQGEPEPAAEAASSIMEPPMSTKKEQPPSPTRSDNSSESEGRPVREKLKETRIDAQASSDPAPGSDQPMNDAPTNGTHADNSTSGSESERGRLRRKRSREDFEDDHEDAKHPEKKHERHLRKKSRDVTSPIDSDVEISTKPAATSVPPISEHEGDETMQSAEAPAQKEPLRPATPDAAVSDKEAAITSPNNKRSREQAEAAHVTSVDAAAEPSEDATLSTKTEDERHTKRPRDGADPESGKASESSTKIPPMSGFSNTSSTSPFATMSAKPQTSKPADKPAENPLQTSTEAFKNSGFGGFASSSASPFALGNSESSSPFAAASGNKLSSFASKSATSTSTQSRLAALGNGTSQSAFGGSSSTGKSTFGGIVAGNGFGGFGGAPKLTSFGSGSGITGLTKKTEKPFGAKEEPQESDSEDEDEDGEEGQGDDEDEHTEERRTSQTLLQAQGPPETGEENEDAVWNGRAKLYTFAGEDGKKTWHERGTGPFKLNVTRDPPTKARLILRADGTHRLLLNAAVTRNMSFGDAQGNKPQDGRLLFTSPASTGEVEQHLLKLKQEKTLELWQAVSDLKRII